MSVNAERVNVTGAATALNGGDAGDYREGKALLLRNRSTSNLDIGGNTVASGAGYELLAGEAITVPLEAGEIVYAIGPSAGPWRVDVFRTGI